MHKATCLLLHLCTRPRDSCCNMHKATCLLLHLCMRPRAHVCCCLCTRPCVCCYICARGHVSAAALVHEATCLLLHLCTSPRVSCCAMCMMILTCYNICTVVHTLFLSCFMVRRAPPTCVCSVSCAWPKHSFPHPVTNIAHAHGILSLRMRIGYHCQAFFLPHVFPTLFVQMRTGWLSMVMAVGQRDHRLVPTIGSVMKLMCECVCVNIQN